MPCKIAWLDCRHAGVDQVNWFAVVSKGAGVKAGITSYLKKTAMVVSIRVSKLCMYP